MNENESEWVIEWVSEWSIDRVSQSVSDRVNKYINKYKFISMPKLLINEINIYTVNL